MHPRTLSFLTSTMSDKHIVLYGIGWRGLLDVVLDQGKYFMRYYWANVVESDHSSDNDDLCGQNQPDIIDSAHITTSGFCYCIYYIFVNHIYVNEGCWLKKLLFRWAPPLNVLLCVCVCVCVSVPKLNFIEGMVIWVWNFVCTPK